MVTFDQGQFCLVNVDGGVVGGLVIDESVMINTRVPIVVALVFRLGLSLGNFVVCCCCCFCFFLSPLFTSH